MGERKVSASADDSLIGTTINGRFKIVSLIARGGMGKVYKAEQSALGRVCALKVLSPNYEGAKDPEFQRRFFLEASTAAKLAHPNTVTIFDYGKSEENGIYYIAMEYIDGRTLHRILHDEGALAEARVIRIAQQICRSLAEAHALGVVHRDLKPGNILLVDRNDEHDVVKVLDFGLVKDVSGNQEDLTQTGLFMGSPKYMAPEQVMNGEISSRTDIYSLGVILYEMICGKPPFERKVSMGTLVAHVNELPPPLTTTNPGLMVSSSMEAIIMRCLEKDPQRRFASMKDLLIALKRTSGDLSETSQSLPRSMVDFEAALQKASAPDSMSGPNSGSVLKQVVSAPPPSGPPPSASGPRRMTPAVPAIALTDSMVPSQSQPTYTGTMAQSPLSLWRVSALALLTAIVGGGGAALVLVKHNAGVKIVANQVPQQVESTALPIATTAAALAVTASNPAAGIRFLRVDTEPPGARVLDRGTEVCMSTPCELVWRGDSVNAEHTLTLLRPGCKPYTLKVPEGEEQVSAKLEFASNDSFSSLGASPSASGRANSSAMPNAPPADTVQAGVSDAPLPSATVAAIAMPSTSTSSTPAASVPEIMHFEEGMTRPALLSGRDPIYTREAIAAQVSGTVIAKCVVTAKGSVTNCRIIKGLPHMDDAVIASLSSRRYSPIMLKGRPVSVDYVFTMKLVPPK